MKHPFLLSLLLPLAALAALTTSHANSTSSSSDNAALRDAASACITALRAEPIQGLPSAEQLHRLSAHLTPGLIAAFRQARVIQERAKLREPGEKPPYTDDDPFSSLSEGVTKWEIEKVFTGPNADPEVRVRQTFDKGPGDAVQWMDTYVFKKAGDTWLLDDIRMGGEWAKGHHMREYLPGGEKEESDHLSPDERWAVTFSVDGGAVMRVEIQAADKSAPPLVVFDHGSGAGLRFGTHGVWNPSSTLFALRLGTGERFLSSVIFRRTPDGWREVKLPDFYPEERKTLTSHGFKEIDLQVSVMHWQDENTVVLRYLSGWAKAEEGDGMSVYIAVNIQPDGSTSIVSIGDTPGPE